MSENVYRPRMRRSRKKRIRKKKWPYLLIAIILLVVIALAGAVVVGYNPLLEKQLRSQFGDDFFSDFEVSTPVKNGEDLNSIIELYEPAFKELENKALQRLENLFESAIEEYQQKENDGTLDRFMLSNKYIQAGRMLEKNVDKTFNALLAEMKSELTSKGHSTAITKKVEETYQQAKNQKKRELLSRLRTKISE